MELICIDNKGLHCYNKGEVYECDSSFHEYPYARVKDRWGRMKALNSVTLKYPGYTIEIETCTIEKKSIKLN